MRTTRSEAAMKIRYTRHDCEQEQNELEAGPASRTNTATDLCEERSKGEGESEAEEPCGSATGAGSWVSLSDESSSQEQHGQSQMNDDQEVDRGRSQHGSLPVHKQQDLNTNENGRGRVRRSSRRFAKSRNPTNVIRMQLSPITVNEVANATTLYDSCVGTARENVAKQGLCLESFGLTESSHTRQVDENGFAVTRDRIEALDAVVPAELAHGHKCCRARENCRTERVRESGQKRPFSNKRT
jgi:hypothetical protein